MCMGGAGNFTKSRTYNERSQDARWSILFQTRHHQNHFIYGYSNLLSAITPHDERRWEGEEYDKKNEWPVCRVQILRINHLFHYHNVGALIYVELPAGCGPQVFPCSCCRNKSYTFIDTSSVRACAFRSTEILIKLSVVTTNNCHTDLESSRGLPQGQFEFRARLDFLLDHLKPAAKLCQKRTSKDPGDRKMYGEWSSVLCDVARLIKGNEWRH
ncbi:hypothetical protein CBL_05542 [Carabus blaptoides fortunei]